MATIPVFPDLPGLTYPVTRSPVWQTDREESIAGLRTRYANRNTPIWQYEMEFSFLRTTSAYPEWQQFVSFYNSLYGAQGLFQYRDPDDHLAVDQLFGSGDGVTSTGFQLVRSGPGLLGTFIEPVYAPSTITSLVVSGTTYSSTMYSLSSGGIINFSSGAPTDGDDLIWTGEFNWLCRFDEDSQELSQFMVQLYELKSLKFSSELLG